MTLFHRELPETCLPGGYSPSYYALRGRLYPYSRVRRPAVLRPRAERTPCEQAYFEAERDAWLYDEPLR